MKACRCIFLNSLSRLLEFGFPHSGYLMDLMAESGFKLKPESNTNYNASLSPFCYCRYIKCVFIARDIAKSNRES